MKTIVASAYAVNPYNGSEDGMGWNYIYQIARFNKVIAFTRENNWLNIEKFMFENPDPVYKNIRFFYFDLPYRLRFWKKGNRGALLYYLLWQKFLPDFIKKQNLQFDIVHNLNFHNDWTPSYLWTLKKPFVWGHIGHHPRIPIHFLIRNKIPFIIKNRLTWVVKKLFWKFSPSLKTTVQQASHILCMNSSVPEVLPMPENKFSISPSVASKDYGCSFNSKPEKFTLISAGRLVSLKGFDLTIASFAKFLSSLNTHKKLNCELLIVGRGPEETRYKKMATDLGIGEFVKFIPWTPREELLNYFRHSTAFLFPSHEGAGMVVAEALSFGLPVICLNNCGPGEYINPDCGFAIEQSGYKQTVNALALAISKLHENPLLLNLMSRNARTQFEKNFNWNLRGEQLHQLYSTL
ncbi:MAG: glycosyltransferase family 4 protein [Bacteroidia bacterium]|nr:glycosyltransferase family 4 protein [Bacteroidia bacterium]